MGLLDDAIREHLDLKRRNGADPTEVERLEREALGPVRRDPAPASGVPDSFSQAEQQDTDLGYADAEAAAGRFSDEPFPDEPLPDEPLQPEALGPAEPDPFSAPSGAVPIEDFEDAEPEAEAPAPPPKRRGLLSRLRGEDLPQEEPEAIEESLAQHEPEAPADPDLPHGSEAGYTPEPGGAHEPESVQRTDPAAETRPPQRPSFGALPSADAPAEPEQGPPTQAYDIGAEFPAEPEADSPSPPQGDELAEAAPAGEHDDFAGRTMEHDVTQHFAADDAPAPEPSPEPEPAEPPEPEPAGRDQQGGEDEDLLEETPDFLQDTPDHDRLWFEQRPPKDFDFDG